MKSFFVLMSLSIFFISCGGEIKNVSYKNDIKPIINEACLDCHNNDQQQGGLNFSSYDDLINARYLNRPQPVVIKGDASQSRFYIAVHSTKPAIRMPPVNFGYDRLSDREIEKIRVWINEGAKNN